MNSNKLILLLLIAAFSSCVNAGALMFFNNPGVVVYQSDDAVSGFYREGDNRRSCYF